MRLKSGFEVMRFSNLDYEKLTALIIFNDLIVAEILQELGPDGLEIDLLPGPKIETLKGRIPLAQFLQAIEVAKYRLGLRDDFPDGVEIVEE